MIRAPPLARWEEEFTRTSVSEPTHRTAHLVYLLDSIMNRRRVAEPKHVDTGTEWILWLRPSAMPHQVPFCVPRKRLWVWRDN